MKNPQKHILDLNFNPIFMDFFAGGGGASTGIYMATGRHPDIAINHNPEALALHLANHPETLHLKTDVFELHPHTATMGRPVAACWFSPDCTHHSKAKGKTPVEKKIRGLAWITLAWGIATDMQMFFLENVEEFKDWGPIIPDKEGNFYPDPKRKGETFEGFKMALSTGLPKDHPALDEIREFLIPFLGRDYDEQKIFDGLGFEVEHKELVACDYGAPTSRKRFFLIARRDSKPIVWPKPTHGNPVSQEVKSGELLPWKTAAECIDWKEPTHSIFMEKDEAAAKKIKVVRPLSDSTLRRIAKGLKKFVFEDAKPFIFKANHTTKNGIYDTFRGGGINEPLKTVTAAPGFALCSAELSISAESGFIAKHYGGGQKGVQPKGSSLNAPLGTITTQDHNGFIEASLLGPCQMNASYIGRDFGKSIGGAIQAPMPTITSNGNGKASLIAFHAVKMKGTNYGYSLNDPTQTITANGLHHGIIQTNMIDFYGNGRPFSKDRPLPTQTTHDRFAIVDICCDEPTKKRIQAIRDFLAEYAFDLGLSEKQMLGIATINGVDYQITDIRMRMLTPKELFRAQGFPEDYIIDPLVSNGKGGYKKLSKTAQVRACGNSVCPPLAAALIGANFSDFENTEREAA